MHLETELTGALEELTRNYEELAERGQVFVTKVRGQEATQQAKGAAKATKSGAKRTATQGKKAKGQLTAAADKLEGKTLPGVAALDEKDA